MNSLFAAIDREVVGKGLGEGCVRDDTAPEVSASRDRSRET